MATLHELVEECHSRILNETGIKSLLSDAFKTMDEEFLNNAVSLIINSVILERVSSDEKKILFSAYGSIGNKKIKANKNEESNYQCQEIKRELLEETLSKGLRTFLETFKDCFINKDILLPKIRKLFKNYKFKKINIVNDYTMLFFSFKLLDMKCDTTDDKSVQNEFAEQLADECFSKLHNPRNKKAVTVSCESLMRYVKQFVYDGYTTDAYVRIMISFVQAIHKSDILPPYIKYDFFKRFIRHIDVINRFIYEAQNSEQDEDVHSEIDSNTDEWYSISEVSKFNYNSIQKAKKYENSESAVNALKEFQKNQQWISKNTSKMDSVSRKEFYRHNSAIANSMMSLLKQTDEIEDISFDVLQRYKSLQLAIGDEYVSAESLNQRLFLDEGLEALAPVAKKSLVKDNPYILLLFATEDMRWIDIFEETADSLTIKLQEYQTRYRKEMIQIHEIVIQTVPPLSAKDCNEIGNTVGLDDFNIPILSASADEPYYKCALYNISLII